MRLTTTRSILAVVTLGIVGAFGVSAAHAADTVPRDPGNLTKYRKNVGRSYQFVVIGKTAGTVYGTKTYTDDSVLAAAAVHAGLLKPGERGIVKVTMVRALPRYKGSTKNGVTTRSYGRWPGAYQVELVKKLGAPPKVGGMTVFPDPGNLMGYRKQVGKSFLFKVTGTTRGTVYGSVVYTDDSPLAAAAVHAGLVKPGETKIVKVTILRGLKRYVGTRKNGVSSKSYGAWSGSYRIQPVKK